MFFFSCFYHSVCYTKCRSPWEDKHFVFSFVCFSGNSVFVFFKWMIIFYKKQQEHSVLQFIWWINQIWTYVVFHRQWTKTFPPKTNQIKWRDNCTFYLILSFGSPPSAINSFFIPEVFLNVGLCFREAEPQFLYKWPAVSSGWDL